MSGVTRFKKSKVIGGLGIGLFDANGNIVNIAAPGGVYDAIADVPTGGSATAADNATAINAILAVLRDAQILKTS
jgi:hypothetical protein